MESTASAVQQQMFGALLVMLGLSSGGRGAAVFSQDPCDSSPCQNGGICGSEFTPMPVYGHLTGPGHCCMCASGFSGEDCSYADPGRPIVCFTCDFLTEFTDIGFHLEAPTCVCGPDWFTYDTISCPEPTNSSAVSARNHHRESDVNTPACFPGSAQVQLQHGGTGPPSQAAARDMRRLNIGDMVLTLDPSDMQYKWSPVFMFSHRFPGVQITYRRLRTRGGATLTATGNHLVWRRRREVLDDADEMGLVEMRDITVGDLMLVTPAATSDAANATAAAHWEPIVRAEWVVEEGLYNPATVHGNIVVDEVLASCYIDMVLPAPLQHLAVWLPKQVYNHVPLQWGRYQQDYIIGYIFDTIINPTLDTLHALLNKE